VDEDQETYSTHGPICPYCKHEHTPDDSAYYQEGRLDCSSCGKEFEMDVYTEVSWTCTKIPEE